MPTIFSLTYLIIILGLIAFHEILHALAFIIAGVPGKEIVFKFSPTPSVHFDSGLKRERFFLPLLLPFLTLGLAPLIYGIAFGDPVIFLTGVIMVTPCVGDLFIVHRLMNLPENALVKSHSTEIGVVVL